VLARTHSESDRIFLQRRGADEAVVGELELALELARRALERFHVDAEVAESSISVARNSMKM
jgi:CPA2 family monovalent cation:H+ antiporter-2